MAVETVPLRFFLLYGKCTQNKIIAWFSLVEVGKTSELVPDFALFSFYSLFCIFSFWLGVVGRD